MFKRAIQALTLCIMALSGVAQAAQGHRVLTAEEQDERRFAHLCQKAEAAMVRHDYPIACQLYHQAMDLGAQKRISPEHYDDLLQQLAFAELQIGELSLAERHLKEMRREALSKDRLFEVLVLMAKVYSRQGEGARAHSLLREAQGLVPVQEWRGEDRTLFTALSISLDDLRFSQLAQAERQFDAGSYGEVAPLYFQLLKALGQGDFPRDGSTQETTSIEQRLRLRLAECHYQLGDAAKALEFLMPVPQNLKTDPRLSHAVLRALLLEGLCHKRLKNDIAALRCFENLLKNSPAGPEYQRIEWEIARCQLALGRYNEAEAAFNRLAKESPDAELALHVQLGLARVDLEKGHATSAEQRLARLDESKNNAYPEISYLKGEAALTQGNYLTAIQRFEEVLQKHPDQATQAEVLCGLGRSFLGLGSSQQEAERLRLLVQAEEYFGRLMALGGDERGALGLARTYLVRRGVGGDEGLKAKVERLLTRPDCLQTVTGKAEALLLRAEASDSPSQKETLYAQLTADTYRETPFFGMGWYRRGLNQLELAEAANTQRNIDRTRFHQTLAATSFGNAASLTTGLDQLQAIKMQARSLYNEGSVPCRTEALALLSRLLETMELQERDELLYLCGLCSATLATDTAEERYVESARKSLEPFGKEQKSSPYAPAALYALGTLLFQKQNYAKAEPCFVQLASTFPESSYAGNGWYWAAQSAEKLGKDSTCQQHRRKVFEKYPQSEFAAEAYFNAFAFSAYLKGEMPAMRHLSGMAMRYPNSPYVIVAHYLNGLNLVRDQQTGGQCLLEAIGAFELADLSFLNCSGEGLIPAGQMEYFSIIHYRSLLEQALALTTLGKELGQTEAYGQAEKLFLRVLGDLENPNHAIASRLMRTDGYPRLLEETQFGMAQLQITVGRDHAAEAILLTMSERYQAAQLNKGNYVARVWYERGRIAMGRRDDEAALTLFREAERANTDGALSSDQRLELWTAQSRCLRRLGRLDEAMLMLSRVINDEAASPLRVKAMLLRAELYELQGRSDLAIKQLEAAAKKGGLWASKAKERLKHEYDYDICCK